MAGGAHGVPVLRTTGPVQPVPMRDGLSGVLVEPAPRFRVPAHARHLHASTGCLHQVLLQGGEAEGVLHLEVLLRAVGAFGADDVLPLAPEEAGGDAIGREGRVVEVAQHRAVGGGHHGAEVVAFRPVRVLLGVAATAGLWTHVAFGKCSGAGLDLGVPFAPTQQSGQCGGGQGRGEQQGAWAHHVVGAATTVSPLRSPRSLLPPNGIIAMT